MQQASRKREAFSFGARMKTKIRYRATIPAAKFTKTLTPRLSKKTEIAHAKNYRNRKIVVFVGRRMIGVDIDEIYPEERAVFYWATEYVGNPLYDMGPVDVERYIPFRNVACWRYEREREEFPFPCVCRFIFGSAK